jgi:IclR family transcriptional regulator, pca regulon regulatory protein
MTKPAGERDLVRALVRGLDVILAFTDRDPRLTLAEVATAVGLARPTARRLLLTLRDQGYVETDGRTFALKPKVLALGNAYLSSLNLVDVARPFMEDAHTKTQQGVSLVALDGPEIVYLARVPSHRLTNLTLTAGTRVPAFAISMGYVLLADLTPSELDQYFLNNEFKPFTAHTITTEQALRSQIATARADGWALGDQEIEDGIRSIAVPIIGYGGRAIAALGLSARISLVDKGQLQEEFLPVLLEAARSISEHFGSSYRSQAE